MLTRGQSQQPTAFMDITAMEIAPISFRSVLRPAVSKTTHLPLQGGLLRPARHSGGITGTGSLRPVLIRGAQSTDFAITGGPGIHMSEGNDGFQ